MYREYLVKEFSLSTGKEFEFIVNANSKEDAIRQVKELLAPFTYSVIKSIEVKEKFFTCRMLRQSPLHAEAGFYRLGAKNLY
jgi:hypothetical protein